MAAIKATCPRFTAGLRLSALALALVLASGAQDLPPVPPIAAGASAIRPGMFGGHWSLFPTSNRTGTEAAWTNASFPGEARAPSGGIQRITLEQVKQSANRAASPLQRLGLLTVEAARQHRLAVRADYFPKFGATAFNLHYTDFLGQIVTVRRPRLGFTQQVPVPLLNQNQTFAALTFVQPITPIFQVHQAVKIARADERIAIAKAGAAAARNTRNAEIEDTYLLLLIAQRQLTSAEWKLKGGESRPLYAGASVDLVRGPGPETPLAEARKSVESAAAKVKELTASLNRIMGWPEDTQLELALPDPLVENITLQDVADKSVPGNADVIEAEQTVVKARAAAKLSKLAYVPTVAAVSGYLFQNVIPAVVSNVGYGGVMASYTLFDFGKREHAVKEAHAQLEMAEIGLQLTKAKAAADVKKSYYELERSRQLSNVAQKMGSSAALLMNVSAHSDNLEVKLARAEMELEMLQADLAHRQASARLKALIGETR
jgi:outer membrane protein TolC